MISIGIFTGYYPYTMAEVIRRIKASGFNCVQLDVTFKDFDAAKEPLTKRRRMKFGTLSERPTFPSSRSPLTQISFIPIRTSARRISITSR